MQKKTFSRAERLAPLLREVVSEALQRTVKDPRVRGAVVTGVYVSSDLGTARVTWYPMEGANPEAVAAGLASVAGFLRGHVGDQLALRYSPRLQFVMDRGVEQGRRVDQIIHALHEQPPDGVAGADDKDDADDPGSDG